MHGIGGRTLMRDNLAGAEFQTLAFHRQQFGVLGVAERLRQPVAQRTRFIVGVAVRGNDGGLAGLQRAVEFRNHQDILGNKIDIAEGAG